MEKQAKVLRYLSQWPRLTQLLNDSLIPLDNNPAENAIQRSCVDEPLPRLQSLYLRLEPLAAGVFLLWISARAKENYFIGWIDQGNRLYTANSC